MKVIIVSTTWWGSDYIPILSPVHVVQGAEFSLDWARKHVAQNFPKAVIEQETTANHRDDSGVEFFIDSPPGSGRCGIDFTVVPLK